MSSIRIENAEVDSTTLRSEVSYSPDLRRFFSGEDFRAEYSVDISDVPERILTLPVVAQVCPVAWSQGADVYVPTMDPTYYDSLQTVKRTLLDMYPELMQGGTVYYKDLAERGLDAEFDGHGQLFTGGVDSMYSFLHHREAEPALINVGGWTVRNEDRDTWKDMQSFLSEFSERYGVDDLYVRSNMLSFLRNVMLIAHCDPYVAGAWYSSIGHGLGLLGLCAPLAYAKGIGKLSMGATHWEGVSFPWGSRPDIVDNVAWTGTESRLVGYERTRHERIEAIADYIREADAGLTLLVCNEEVNENCGRCGKCCRTAISLMMAGVDSNDHGLPLSPKTFQHTRTQLEAGNWKLSANERLFWRDLQAHVPVDPEYPIDGAEEFLEWLREADIDALARRERSSLENQVLYPLYRNIPHQVFNALDSRLEAGPFSGR